MPHGADLNMAENVRIVTNLPDFKAQLRTLGLDFERRVFRAGTNAAAQVFKKLAIQHAPVLKEPRKDRVPGLLRRAIYVKRSRARTAGREHYFVGVRQGKSARRRRGGNLDAFYWRFLEDPRGHLARGPGQRLRGGRRRVALERERLRARAKRVKPYPFLAPAFQQGQDAALRAFNDRVQKRIDAENRKRPAR